MPTVGFIIEHDAHQLSALTLIAGRSVIGHVVDQIRRVQADADIVVASSSHLTEDLSNWVRWSGLRYETGAAEDIALANQWDQTVRVSAHVPILPHRDVYAAICLVNAGTAQVRVGGERKDLPIGCFANVIGHFGSPNSYDLDITGAATDPGLIIFPKTEAAANELGLVVDRAGRMPADLRFGDSALPTTSTPWQGKFGPMMIAEIGGNHEGDFDTALRMTEQAIRSGADCVKFQLYLGATLVSPVESPDRHKHFKKFELSQEQHIALAKKCRAAGVIYNASVWDADMLEWIDPYLDFYKVGSGDLTAWQFLADLAKRGKPILLSTGLATLDDVAQAVEYIRSVNSDYSRREMLCVMQCTSMYPIPDEDAHIRVMESLSTLNVSVGYSDHTIGDRALVAATAMGAEVLEFHFTDQRENQSFRDHKVSLLETEVRALSKELARISACRGSLAKRPQASETEVGHELSFRRGVYTKVDLKEGEVFSAENLICLRPAHGTDGRDYNLLIGKTAKTHVAAFAAIIPGHHF